MNKTDKNLYYGVCILVGKLTVRVGPCRGMGEKVVETTGLTTLSRSCVGKENMDVGDGIWRVMSSQGRGSLFCFFVF